MSAFVGHDVETGDEIRICDTARRSGLYVLGRPGMGKTSLLTTLIEQDIQNGHGVFFLDPHGDGIDTLLARHCSVRTNADGELTIVPASSVILLDPTSEHDSFGINLLACSDLSSRNARRDTYNRAYNVFYKLWQQEWDQRPWLRLIVQHTLHAFIENQGYTLADVPLFLDPANTSFRDHIVSNIRHNQEVADFWRNQFDAKREWDQQRQVDAALSRVRELLGDPDVRDIVGQTTTTLDFSDIIANGRILFVTLPPRLAYDSKRFIGTILVNELLQAVYRRGELPPERRRQFCIFVDEFQHFCAWEDFTALFNEGRKYGIATTIAHQERYGQFAENKPIIGATDAAANKIMFALSVRDAEEIAPEFAKEPTVIDVRYEPQLVISQDPFADLLKGHVNPRIRVFVNNYLRPLKEALDDLPDQISYTRTLRQSALDRAQISRIDERLDALLGRDSSYSVRSDALTDARALMLSAEEYTGDLLGLYQSSKGHRITVRQINKFLTALMEGTISPGQTAFGEFLIGCALEVCQGRAPREFYPALRAHIALTYGDPTAPLVIPTTFAQAHGLFSKTFAIINAEHAKLKEEQKAQHAAEFWNVRQQLHDETLESATTEKARFGWTAGRTLSQLDSNLGVFDKTSHGLWHTEELLGYFLWLLAYPELQSMFSPYLNGRFACIVPPWSHIDTTPQILARLMHDVSMLRREANYTPPAARGLRGWLGQTREDDDPPGFSPYAPHIRPHVLDAFEHFLNQHGEGALVVLALLQTVGYPTKWGSRLIPAPELYRFVVRDNQSAPSKPATEAIQERWANGKSKIPADPEMLRIPIKGYKEYPGYSMVWLPPVRGHAPIDIALFVDKIIDMMRGRDVQSDCRRFYQRLNSRDPYESIREGHSMIENILKAQTIKTLKYVADLLDKDQNITPVFANPSRIWNVLQKAADDLLDDPTVGNMLIRLARRAVQGRDTTDSSLAFVLVLRYLCCRVSDIINFGTTVADISFPQPSVFGMTTADVKSNIDDIVLAARQPEIEEERKREAEWRRKCEAYINRSLEHISNSIIPMLPQLPAVIPTMEDSR